LKYQLVDLIFVTKTGYRKTMKIHKILIKFASGFLSFSTGKSKIVLPR